MASESPGPGGSPGPGPGPLEKAANEELRGILDDEISRLPDRFRVPVVLCYLQGQTYVQAAKLLGLSAGTVAVRLARARDRLRARFVGRGIGLSAALMVARNAGEALACQVPTALFAKALNLGASSAVGASALAATASGRVISVAQGALQTMWTSKMKATLLVVVALGLVCTGLGLTRHFGPTAQAQGPYRAEPKADRGAQPGEDQVLERELELLERQLHEL